MREIFFNGKIYTGGETLQEAFLVEDGCFGAVGKNAEILALADENTPRTDLQGRFVCPGFNDSHMHLVSYGRSLGAARLAEHTGSLAELLAYLRDFAAKDPPQEGKWLTGRGWNQDYFADVSRMPDRHDLDAVSEDFPIMITRACGHCCVVNSRALEIAGIGPDSASPPGGLIGMADGRPDGRLYDNAIELASACIPEPDKEEIKDMIRRACRALSAYGITSVQTDDYSTFSAVPFETVNAAYREMEESGELTVRVYEQANFSEFDELRRFIEAGNVTGSGSRMFRIGPLKMLGDGSLGSRTAWLSSPYADSPDTCGFPLFAKDEMERMIAYAHENGMQIAVHAIGDACLDMVLDALEKALQEHPRADHRHGIVHCQISRPEQLRRIGELGLHVYAQSVFLDYDNHIAEKRVGPELAASSYSWKTLMKSGASVSNGSDCPVEVPDVMRGIECAVTRTSLDGTGPYLPQEAFTLKEALDGFTVRGAEASFEEDFKGRIVPGFAADFTVLDEDPFGKDPRALHEIGIAGTYLGGRAVFARKEEGPEAESRKIRNVVFDIGGVLADFRPERLMEALGFSEEAKEAFRREIFGRVWLDCDRIPYGDGEIRALFKAAVPGFEAEVDCLWDGLAPITCEMPYAQEWLRSLKARGFRIYILSNYGRRSYEINSPRYGFLSLADGALISYEVRQLKPEPEIYMSLCARFGLRPEESVFIDDVPANVEAAERLGFAGIVFATYESAAAGLEALIGG